MPNGDFSLVQKSVHQIVYKGICQLCQQPTNVPFEYMGKRFTHESDTRASKAHVISQRDGGKWYNSNILEAHQYCNNLMQCVSDLGWIVSVLSQNYTTLDALKVKLNEAGALYVKTLEVMDGKRTSDAETIAVLKPVAEKILRDPESNIVRRIYPKRRETILQIAA